MESWLRRPGLVWLVALLVGPAVAGLLTPARAVLDGTHVVLVLVLVVAAVASAGRPPAGLVAAVTSGLAYDFFWTRPYGSLRVLGAAEIWTVVLLVLVGAAIEQLSWWGGRQRAAAARRSGYLAALAPQTVADAERTVAELLDADTARLVLDGRRPSTVLEADGSLVRDGQRLRVDVEGLPTDDLIAVPVPVAGHPDAHFAVVAASHVARPTTEQRRVAALLGQLSSGLTAGSGSPSPPR